MFDTYVTIVGNVLTAPEWRRTTQTNSLVANFKVASTARRLDRETGRWVDGNSLRVRVNCWRKLAEGVASSVMVGDPIVVVGRMYTRDWTDSEGNHRTLYEVEAVAVGHDLARGRGKFARNRPTMATSAVEDAEADARVHGEATEAVPDEEAPARRGEHLFDDGDADFANVPISPAPGYDPLASLRGGGLGGRGFGPTSVGGDGHDLSEFGDDPLLDEPSGSPRSELDPLPAEGPDGGPEQDSGSGPDRGLEPDSVPADGLGPEAEPTAARGRRGRGRVAVPA